jgi:hypothetical protein
LSPNGSGVISAENSYISNVLDPVSNQDAATKKYIDDLLAGGSTLFSIDGDIGGPDGIQSAETVTFGGGSGITTTITDNLVTISGDNATTTTKGVASFNATNFTVTDGAVSANDITLGTTALTIGESTTGIAGLTTFSVGDWSFAGDSAQSISGNGLIFNDTIQIYSDVTKALGDSATNVFSVLDVNGDNLFEVRENGDAIIGGVLTVEGNGTSTFAGDVDIGGALQVQNGATITANLSADNMTITGNLNVYGNTLFGDSEANDTVTFVARIASELEPDASNIRDLGTNTNKWRDLYLEGTAYAGAVTAGQLNVDNIQINDNTIASTAGVLYIDPNPIDSDGGEVIVRGNFTVQGVTTTVNSTTVSINDKNIVLADSAASAGEADGAGITVNGPTTPATITYNGSTDAWNFNKDIDLTSFSALKIGGTDLTEALEDHLITNFFLEGEGIDLTYVDASNTLTISAELATFTNPGVASFDSDQFTVTSGAVVIVEIDGGSF